jgi:hypothetical protein
MSTILNYTPHTITVLRGDITINYPSMGIARVGVRQETAEPINGIPCFHQIFGVVEGLPDPQPDTFFIVSALVKGSTFYERSDVIAPDTGKTAIRNEDGHIVAVCGFII